MRILIALTGEEIEWIIQALGITEGEGYTISHEEILLRRKLEIILSAAQEEDSGRD